MKCNATLIHQVMSVTETSTTSNIAGEWDSEWKGPKDKISKSATQLQITRPASLARSRFASLFNSTMSSRTTVTS